MKKIKSWILQRWGSLKVETQNWIIGKVETLLNYIINSIIVSIPIYLILFLKYDLKLYNYFILVVIVLTALPFIEHYYVWFREDWKKDITD